MMLTPKNWLDFQHYKDRCPPWIKLHRDLLNDRAFMTLPLASKALAPLLWLLASESTNKNGVFDASTEELEFRLRISADDIQAGLKPLIDKGFFLVDSSMLAECKQDASSEREGERETETEGEAEREKESRSDVEHEIKNAKKTAVMERFERFYQSYPVKKSKGAAEKSFQKLNPDDLMLSKMLKAVRLQSEHREKLKAADQFTPEWKHPATWLNQRCWEDELQPITTSNRKPNTSLDWDDKTWADDVNEGLI